MVENSKKAEIKVSGMACAECALTIKKTLNKVEGVDEAKVNFRTKRATIKYDPDKVKLSELEKAIENTGYDVIK